MRLHSGRGLVISVLAMALVFLLQAGGAWAPGDVVRRNLTGRVDLEIFPLYDGPHEGPSGLDDPDTDDLLARLVDLLDDIDEPDEGDRAILDPAYFHGVFETTPDFELRLDDYGESGLERILAVVYLYNRLDERWVFFSRHVGGWRDDTVSFGLEITDGGRYDLGRLGDDRVEVAMALGVGVVEEYDGPSFWLRFGGCSLARGPLVIFCLLLCVGLAVSGKRV